MFIFYNKLFTLISVFIFEKTLDWWFLYFVLIFVLLIYEVLRVTTNKIFFIIIAMIYEK